MGYDVHITRQQNWFDKDDANFISVKEWKDYIETDPEFRLDNYAETTTANGETVKVVSDGLSVWTAYSGNGIDGNYAWFMYNRGEIVVKNPDKEIINKMIEVANELKAKVQGDEGEVYDKNLGNKITTKQLDNGINELEKKKKWWKLW